MDRIGSLVYDERSGRMDIRFGLEEYYDGLHCGTGMDVMLDGKWVPTRIEMDIKRKWYLAGVDTDSLIGLTVRI